MDAVGFLTLPSWTTELRQGLVGQEWQDRLLRAPVLDWEDVEQPWSALPPDEFFSCVETGFHFADGRSSLPDRWTPRVITSDAALGCRRFLQGHRETTGVRGAIGGTFPLLDLCHPGAGYPAPQRLWSASDGVAVAALSEMEQTGRPLDEAMQNVQWRNLAPGNVTRHLHGLVTRDRLALLAGLVFGVNIDPEAISCEGFGKITPRDMEVARSLGMKIRLLGAAEQTHRGLVAWVRPVLLPARYLLAQLRSGSEGAYVQHADQSSTFFSGTATCPSVILRGMIRDWLDGSSGKSASSAPRAGDDRGPSPASLVEAPGGVSLRFSLTHFDLTVARILNILAAHGIGLKSLCQPDVAETDVGDPELVIFTRPVEEKVLQDALREIREQVRLATLKACLRTEG